jgi:hypothetical protein
MFWPAIIFLILVWLFGRNVFRAIWWIIGLGILAIVGLAWFGSTLPDQPKPAAVAPTPTPKLLEYANSSEAAGSPTPAPTTTPSTARIWIRRQIAALLPHLEKSDSIACHPDSGAVGTSRSVQGPLLNSWFWQKHRRQCQQFR